MTDAYTRPYGDATTSNFPKMGESLLGALVNVSGDRSPYTYPRAKSGPSGDVLATGGTAARGVGSMATGEHSGPVFAPQTTISFPNSPESSQTGRGLRVVPSVASRSGNGGFWDQRASQSGQVIAD